MYEKFSQRVSDVVKQAREIAREADQEYLGTEHVLLAIVREGTGVGARLLSAFGVDEYALKAELDRLVKKNMEQTWVFGDLPGSPHLKNTVAAAVTLARQIGSKEVCTQHLLLAMLKENGSVAQRALGKFGLTYDNARVKIEDFMTDE